MRVCIVNTRRRVSHLLHDVSHRLATATAT